jgi:hypothetical protein
MYVRRAGSGSAEVDVVYVSGDEGIFTIEIMNGSGDQVVERIIDRAVSELAVFDLDDDGEEEIVTIEPFHGDRIGIYKRFDSGWEQVFKAQAELGHGIWAGGIDGTGSFIHGSRAGERDLCLYRVIDPKAWKLEKTVIEHGTGTAQLDVKPDQNRDLLFTSNNYTDEVAVYELKP